MSFFGRWLNFGRCVAANGQFVQKILKNALPLLEKSVSLHADGYYGQL